MAKKLLLTMFIVALSFVNAFAARYDYTTMRDANGMEYKTAEGDPLAVRIYNLANGLTVYLSVNKNAPRIETYIVTRAGSTYDPADNTGLAHYLEHLMFKGTSKIATSDWQKEKPLLDEISALFERHKAENDPARKKEIYKLIDSVSGVAAKYANANEYDKILTQMGASGTNAYTSEERTVFLTNIPANEFEKWLRLESERFSDPQLRLFHTELETVYEEYNMYQDMDDAKVDETLRKTLFLKHPYGTQQPIGKPEHLKNPSMVNILKYFRTYYVPNNMAICLSGDFDPDRAIRMINEYFNSFKPGDVPQFVPPVESTIEKHVERTVMGPDAESIRVGFRIGGIKSDDYLNAIMIDMILNNSVAGIMDLDLVQKQKVLSAGTSVEFMKDYGIFNLYGQPREGQSLEELKNLLMGEIEKIKKGEFDDWLVEAVVNNFKLNRMRSFENTSIAHTFVDLFANGREWSDYLKQIDRMKAITKAQLVNFAKSAFKENYVVIYKRTGKDTTVVKVEKPQITPVDMNREAQSEFYNDITSMKVERLNPEFVDYDKSIRKIRTKSGLTLNYIKNVTNELFQLNYILDMGSKNNKKLPLAVNLLSYLGTNKYTPAAVKQEFYKLGISLGVYAGDERTYVSISGLSENFEKGMALLEHVISECKPNDDIYKDYVGNIIKERADSKLDKSNILWRGMLSFGQYGEHNPFRNIIPEKELRRIDPGELTNIIKGLFGFKHYVFYYGNDEDKKVKGLIDKYHKINTELADIPKPEEYKELNYIKNKVYFVNYDMVQVNMIMLAKDKLFDRTILPQASLFNEYFGGSMSSIVFQEIRESKALAYSAFGVYATPAKPDRSNYIYGFLGTQPDKLKIATDAMLGLMNLMPKSEKSFDASRDAIMKSIETNRIIKSSIFWNWLANHDLGIDYDRRADTYKEVQTMDTKGLENFFNDHVKGKKYVFLVMGNKSAVDMNVLKELGDVEEVSLEQLFGY